MGFFDDLVLPEEPAAERTALVRLGPPGEDEGRYAPPVDRYAPAFVRQLGVAGDGPEARVVVTGWSMWPRSATLHLSVFRRTRWQGSGPPRKSGLRVGLLFSDGRRVTSLDPTVMRDVSYTDTEGQQRRVFTPQATGLIPLDPGMGPLRRSTFKTDVDLYLPELPPPGEARLVVEWPDEEIGETSTAVDVAALRAAASTAMEVWPGLEPPDPATQPTTFVTAEMSGPPNFLAPPLSEHELSVLRREDEARQRYVPRDDWQQLGYHDWEDAALVRVRLEEGAPVDARVGWPEGTPLHQCAARGAADSVAVLLAHGAAVDASDEFGHTPLWHAVCSGSEQSIRALIDAGADVWTEQTGPWSPGLLLLTTPLAPLVAGLPGARELPAEDAAAFRAADELIAAFGEEELWTEGLGIAFVRGLDEDEVIRRLGAAPADCPLADLEHAPFADEDFEESLRWVGVTSLPGAPGGCVITQEGYLPSDEAVLAELTHGTAAYGIYYNPKGGIFGTLARDGRAVGHEEIGLTPDEAEPAAAWHFRWWQRGAFSYGADTLAYACSQAGLRITDAGTAADRHAPRRWVRLPDRLQR
ncbi:ankyrin repeat domain-containing protein [Streptomyces indicus]|uniref:Ankyrin repeat-containing protein n=1 Tax=Streptomyces indicus TaxID=417292 RepID=A0A1G9DYE3_9ACTN|nr:ankyrin repeat domain-containing protein [Streptomyces indicus]SDK68895.1 Ankyrin repeat-containing protein [Streptomyces indicus]